MNTHALTLVRTFLSMLGMMRIRPHLFTGVLDDER